MAYARHQKNSSILVTRIELGDKTVIMLQWARQKKKRIIETVMEWSAVPAGMGRRELSLATT